MEGTSTTHCGILHLLTISPELEDTGRLIGVGGHLHQDYIYLYAAVLNRLHLVFGQPSDTQDHNMSWLKYATLTRSYDEERRFVISVEVGHDGAPW